jgi:nucleotide-binding universal stress UspA family protein
MKIVVGIDGSEASSDALRYAHGEAVSSGAELVAVTVWEVPVMAAAYITTEEVDGAMDPWMEGFIAEVLGEDGAAVKRAPASGSAAAALLEEAEDADTLIVGTRGHGGLAGVIMGSVSHQLANHTPCPLTVVPASNGAAGAADGPIVVGVDGSSNAQTALRWAAERAARTGLGLRVVMAWRGEAAGWLAGTEVQTSWPSFEDLEQQAREMLGEVIDEAGLPEGLEPELVLGEGAPASVLREAADGGSMLVLGSRGRGGFMGLLLGSVTSHTLNHIFCPTTVVPAQ